MPIAMIVSSMRCALEDMDGARIGGDPVSYWSSYRQLEALINEIEKLDETRKRIAANDTEARG